jgi:Ni,Fe-hydrogenase III component G
VRRRRFLQHDVHAAELPKRAETLLRDGHRLALVAAHHDADAVRLVHLFVSGPPDTRIELHPRAPRPARPEMPSLAHLPFPAGRFEREMHDLHGVVPLDHPLPRRLVRHFHWPKGWYPMHPDAGEPPAFGEQEGPCPFLEITGDGVYEIPVGPVHAGLIEPGLSCGSQPPDRSSLRLHAVRGITTPREMLVRAHDGRRCGSFRAALPSRVRNIRTSCRESRCRAARSPATLKE